MDDEPIARQILTGKLKSLPEVELAGEAAKETGPVEAAELKPSLLPIMDLQTPAMSAQQDRLLQARHRARMAALVFGCARTREEWNARVAVELEGDHLITHPVRSVDQIARVRQEDKIFDPRAVGDGVGVTRHITQGANSMARRCCGCVTSAGLLLQQCRPAQHNGVAG